MSSAGRRVLAATVASTGTNGPPQPRRSPLRARHPHRPLLLTHLGLSHGAGPLDPVVLDREPFELLASVIGLGSLSQCWTAPHGILRLLFRAGSGGIGLALKWSEAVGWHTDG